MSEAVNDETSSPGVGTGDGTKGRVRATRKTGIATCACGARWPGETRAAHCGNCHETFTGITAFDAHRSNRGEHGWCLHPTQAKLVDAERSYPCWGFTGEGNPWRKADA